jgi:hypothetical protein
MHVFEDCQTLDFRKFSTLQRTGLLHAKILSPLKIKKPACFFIIIAKKTTSDSGMLSIGNKLANTLTDSMAGHRQDNRGAYKLDCVRVGNLEKIAIVSPPV